MASVNMNSRQTRAVRRNFITSWLATMLTTLVLCAVPLHGQENQARVPSVLFVNVKPHAEYVAKPLHEMGIAFDTCEPGKLGEFDW